MEFFEVITKLRKTIIVKAHNFSDVIEKIDEFSKVEKIGDIDEIRKINNNIFDEHIYYFDNNKKSDSKTTTEQNKLNIIYPYTFNITIFDKCNNKNFSEIGIFDDIESFRERLKILEINNNIIEIISVICDYYIE